jgi:hypothetical protein
MSEEFLKKAKQFKRNCGIFSIILYILAGVLIYQDDLKTFDIEVFTLLGAVCLSCCYFSIRSSIKNYEEFIDKQ